jgi:hypothetical protein
MQTNAQVPAYSIDYSPTPLLAYAPTMPWYRSYGLPNVGVVVVDNYPPMNTGTDMVIVNAGGYVGPGYYESYEYNASGGGGIVCILDSF